MLKYTIEKLVASNHRLTIPLEIRKLYNIKAGDTISITTTKDSIIIKKVVKNEKK